MHRKAESFTAEVKLLLRNLQPQKHRVTTHDIQPCHIHKHTYQYIQTPCSKIFSSCWAGIVQVRKLTPNCNA